VQRLRHRHHHPRAALRGRWSPDGDGSRVGVPASAGSPVPRGMGAFNSSPPPSFGTGGLDPFATTSSFGTSAPFSPPRSSVLTQPYYMKSFPPMIPNECQFFFIIRVCPVVEMNKKGRNLQSPHNPLFRQCCRGMGGTNRVRGVECLGKCWKLYNPPPQWHYSQPATI